jgi:hypothetical protein
VQSGLGGQDRTQWPGWVRFGLWGLTIWGLTTRKWALIFLWDEPLFVGLSIVAGFLWSPVFFYVGIYFSVRALWYWMALRWVDKHDAW